MRDTAAEAAGMAAGLLGDAIKEVVGAVGKDKAKRDGFSRDVVQKATEKCPDYDAVTCCVKHKMEGAFVHQHAECYYTLGTSKGYEVYLVHHGDKATFTLLGDGGWINWAVQGSHWTRDGSVVHFQ